MPALLEQLLRQRPLFEREDAVEHRLDESLGTEAKLVKELGARAVAFAF